MPNRNYVKIGNILKRSICSNSDDKQYIVYHEAGTQNEVSTNYHRLNNLLESELGNKDPRITDNIRQYTRIFKNNISSIENASTYCTEALNIIEKLNAIDESFADKFASEFASYIVPYVDSSSLNDIKERALSERYAFSSNQKQSLVEAANNNIAADRIIANNERMCKRFYMENEITKLNTNSMESVVEKCADMIDTYSIPTYAKLNTCIEEMVYIVGKDGIKCDKGQLVKSITENFLLRYPSLSNKEINGYKKALYENCTITDEEAELAVKIFNPQDDNSITSYIDSYLISNEKDISDIDNIIENLDVVDPIDIIYHFIFILKLIYATYKADTFTLDDENYLKLVKDLFIKISEIAIDGKISRDNIFSIIDKTQEYLNTLNYSSADMQDTINKISAFKDAANKGIGKLKDFCAISYSDSNVEIMQQLNHEAAEVMPLNEFKIFKFHNLVNAAFHLDRFLANKIKGFRLKNMTKKKKFIRKAKNILFGENARIDYTKFDINDYISENGRCDITVDQYYVDEADELEANNFLAEACKEYNHILENNGDYDTKAYYIMNPGVAEIHVEASTGIELTEDEKIEASKHIDPLFETYLNDVEETYNLMEGYINPENRTLEETLSKCFEENDNLTVEHYKMIMECLQYLNVDESIIESFTDNFKRYRYNYLVENEIVTEASDTDYLMEEGEINYTKQNFIKENDVPVNIQLEAYKILINVLEAAPTINKPKLNIKKPNIKVPKIGASNNKTTLNGDKVDGEKKFGGINLNSLRLSLEGLKSSFKNFNQKQQEASKKADFQSRQFSKALKNAFISDKRESIIKGSVIPSFSKLCRWGLVLAGLGIITHNPIVPAIAAIGAFGVSKHLTKQERLLLLDDIETELEVVDKELQMADSKNQMKKYRALLKYKKDLQRQYQRIKYNIRVGKDILPGSEVGTPHNND